MHLPTVRQAHGFAPMSSDLGYGKTPSNPAQGIEGCILISAFVVHSRVDVCRCRVCKQIKPPPAVWSSEDALLSLQEKESNKGQRCRLSLDCIRC
jgi:hypothetical protein